MKALPIVYKNVCERDFCGLNQIENRRLHLKIIIRRDVSGKTSLLYSTCEHHLLPIIGRAHVAYISNGRVIGLSKNESYYYSKRPQVQERLTCKLCRSYNALGTQDVACD
jgi:GTP cyclohydrolase I